MSLSLYVDGGVVRKNPSPIAGTWAFVIVLGDEIIAQNSGAITPTQFDLPAITNNQTEMYALLMGLLRVPNHPHPSYPLNIYSDSQVTLGRCFQGWKWKNIPDEMHKIYKEQWKRLRLHESCFHTLLAGHPTRAQLATGIGRHGLPVSKYNVLCDRLCTEAGERYLAKL